jgi:hypothetical protein
MDQLNTSVQKPLPNSTAVLVLGIVSIVLCWCWGIGLITGIIAMVLAAKDKKLFAAAPEAYTEGSLKNLNAGRICAIIGIILSLLYLVYIVVIISMFGFEAMRNPQQLIEQMQKMK